MPRNQIRLFSGKGVTTENKDRKRQVRQDIQGEDANTILNADKSEYLDYIVDKYRYGEVNINLEGIEFDVESYRPDTDLTVIIPAVGDVGTLQYEPQTSRMNSYIAEVERVDGEEGVYELHIDVSPRGSGGWNQDRVNQAINGVKDYIQADWPNLQNNIEQFHSQLRQHAERIFDQRRQEAREQREMFGSVDVPLRRRDDTPETIAIEVPDRREPIEKPEVDAKTAGEPAPTVPPETYQKILTAINDIGTGFERSPALFADCEEEELRDFIRVLLEMNFVHGTATGETFNKEGKTDILLRAQDGTNVFVSECGVWDGKEHFKGKIDQLFDYLTWRDSKAAVIMFVDRQDMETIRKRIEEGADEHGVIDELEEQPDESWWQYSAHFPGNPDRNVELAILAFHIPSE